MQDLLNFLEELLPMICEFLMTEPINYFVGILFVLFIGQLINRLIR